jgi:phosphatidylglycerophosphate synthase
MRTQFRTRWAEEARSDWAYVVFYRPASVALAWALARTAVTPMAVTLAGGFSIPLMIAAAILLPATVAVPVVGLVGYLGGLLDCVDGDLARLVGRTSWIGRYVDFQIDVVRWAVLFVAVGHAADRASDGSGLWLGLAALAAWLRLFARAARDYRGATLGRDPQAASAPTRPSVAVLGTMFVAGLDGLLPIFLGAGWLFGLGGGVVMLPLGLAVLDAVTTQHANIRRYRRA